MENSKEIELLDKIQAICESYGNREDGFSEYSLPSLNPDENNIIKEVQNYGMNQAIEFIRYVWFGDNYENTYLIHKYKQFLADQPKSKSND